MDREQQIRLCIMASIVAFIFIVFVIAYITASSAADISCDEWNGFIYCDDGTQGAYT
jgi:hypothetical protein